MSVQKISNAILGVGVDDTTIDLFESQYGAYRRQLQLLCHSG